MYYLFSVFITSLYLGFSAYNNKKGEVSFLVLFVLLCTIFIGMRAPGVDFDYVNYANEFHYIYNEYALGKGLNFFVEPLYKLLIIISYPLGSFFVFLLFCFISLLLKIIAFYRLGMPIGIILMVYFSSLLMIHEFTQIRASIAIGIFLIGVSFYREASLSFLFVIIILSVGFHSSGLLSIVLLSNKLAKRSKLDIAFLVIFLFFFFLALAGFDFMFNLLSWLSERMSLGGFSLYITAIKNNESEAITLINVFSIINLIVLVVSSFLYFFRKSYWDWKGIIVYKVFLFSQVAYYAFFGVPVFAFRVSEFYLISLPLLLSYMFVFFKPKWIYMLFLTIYVLIAMSLNIERYEIIKSYNITEELSLW